jgi:lipopolysaccharide biosynthesis protein
MSDTRAIAFYLPQYHPIPENDVWWGKGFTEWTNVARGRPFFKDHEQPHLPGELGFYDLRLPEVRSQQAALARKHGIHGFCYYYYWFNGRRLLERPLDEVLRSREPDFPFCICWANENWTRRWDGAEDDILLEQVHTATSDADFIRDIIPILKDPRYIRVDGAPLLLVYRPAILQNPLHAVDVWRREARAAGLEALHLCAVQSFGFTDPRPIGFDAVVEFPPHGIVIPEVTHELKQLDPLFRGRVYDYRDAVSYALTKPSPPYRSYRTVMTSWDNTARRGADGNVFAFATPHDYEVWLRGVIAETSATLPPGQRLIFINAWNEWAEGAHLEPDQRHGSAHLQATARALRQRSDWRAVVQVIRKQRVARPELLLQYADDLEFALEAQSRALSYLQRIADVVARISVENQFASFSSHTPSLLRETEPGPTARLHVDRVRGTPARDNIILRRGDPTYLEGWAFAQGMDPSDPEAAAYLTLTAVSDETTYFAPLFHRHRRDDVAISHRDLPVSYTLMSGFGVLLSCDDCPAGEYRLAVAQVFEGRATLTEWPHPVIVE